MKTVLLVLTVIAFANTDGVVDKSEDFDSNVILRQLFEMLKYFIKNGCDKNGFPMTDPFEFDYKYYKFYLPNKLLSLQAAFTNGVIFGLSNFNVQHTKFIRDEIAIELCINFPLVTFHSDSYEINGDIYEIMPIIGKGNFEFAILNFTFSGKVFLTRSDDERSIVIKNIYYPQFSIQEIVVSIIFTI
ncbi:unnamed protein product [Euphydryas editha]|uniref:Uncharacterized protein n=1 Tax=Euphydryas editha TaxID=104508 RepID=A0AAU9USN5_EUPED|nr:unnamed protein product [Euphydryas editha]